MVQVTAMGELNYTIMATGVLFVMISGTLETLQLYADSWAVESQDQPQVKPTLEEELAPLGWMMLNAMGQNQPSVNAQEKTGGTVTAIMERMLVWYAQVGPRICDIAKHNTKAQNTCMQEGR